jgi:hypothetical protein
MTTNFVVNLRDLHWMACWTRTADGSKRRRSSLRVGNMILVIGAIQILPIPTAKRTVSIQS